MISSKAKQLAAEEAQRSADRKSVNDILRGHQDNLCNLRNDLKKQMVRLLDVRAVQNFYRSEETAEVLQERRTSFQFAVDQYNYAKEDYLDVVKKLMAKHPDVRNDWNELIYNCPTVTDILETMYGFYRRGEI